MTVNRPETAAGTTGGKMDCFESIRGLAAFAVLLGHLVIAFWSALYVAGPLVPGAHSSLIHMAARTPLRVLWEAQWAVSTFFVLSGFVLTLSYFRSGKQATMSSAAVRRYFRLMIPAAASILFAYVLLKCGWMYNRTAVAYMDGPNPSAHWWLNIFYNFKPSFRVALKDCFWTTFFGNGSLYNQNLWTMPVELQGSFLVYTFAVLFGKLRNRWLVYSAVSFILICTNQMFMLNFVLGALLADAFVWAEKREWRRGRRGRWPPSSSWAPSTWARSGRLRRSLSTGSSWTGTRSTRPSPRSSWSAPWLFRRSFAGCWRCASCASWAGSRSGST